MYLQSMPTALQAESSSDRVVLTTFAAGRSCCLAPRNFQVAFSTSRPTVSGDPALGQTCRQTATYVM